MAGLGAAAEGLEGVGTANELQSRILLTARVGRLCLVTLLRANGVEPHLCLECLAGSRACVERGLQWTPKVRNRGAAVLEDMIDD